ncbi:hypothetical protein PSPTOT1_2127 [Pseudomonas syringae pv. tomato T1]|nr:hypothetical protein PSPTOT1_2127 [Pseudomonas syringae pv. tomato T1]
MAPGVCAFFPPNKSTVGFTAEPAASSMSFASTELASLAAAFPVPTRPVSSETKPDVASFAPSIF